MRPECRAMNARHDGAYARPGTISQRAGLTDNRPFLLQFQFLAVRLIAAEDHLWEQRRYHEVRRVDHIGYAKIDGNAADDIRLLPAKPSLLQ
jgi:hypothetical protein